MKNIADDDEIVRLRARRAQLRRSHPEEARPAAMRAHRAGLVADIDRGHVRTRKRL